MTDSDVQLIPPSLLYRFELPCHELETKWSAKTGIKLDETCRLPTFGVLDNRKPFADVRMAWSADGLFLTVDVTGKQQTVWCRETQLVESDGLQVWIDTRNTHNVHRAGRFCHWFLFLPTGGGSRRDGPIGSMLKINRSKDDPRTLNQVAPKVISKIKHGGYSLAIHIPARALDGWDPQEHRKLGFNFAVVDRELGWQTLSTGPEFPVSEDPSLWQAIALTS